MEKTFDEIKKEFANFMDNAAAAVGGNKAAGARSRKASLAIERMMKEWRKVSVKEAESK